MSLYSVAALIDILLVMDRRKEAKGPGQIVSNAARLIASNDFR